MAFASFQRPLASMLQENYYAPQSQPLGAPTTTGAPVGLSNVGYDISGAPAAGGTDLTGAISNAVRNGGAVTPPVTPGTAPQSPYSVTNPPTHLGPTLQPGVSRDYWGGPPARMNMVIDPRTGRRARGAADIMASMVAGGFRPKGMPDFAYSFEDAARTKAEAMAQLAANYGSLSTMDKGIYDAELAGGQYNYDEAMGIGETNYDAQGNYVGLGGEGAGYGPGGYDPGDQALIAAGYGPMPRSSWGVGEWPTQDQLSADEKAYYDWLNKGAGFSPPPTPLDQY